MLLNGLNLAFNAGFLTNIIKQSLLNEPEDELNKKLIYVFLGLGVAEMDSGYITGKRVDIFSTRTSIFMNHFLSMSALAYSFFCIYITTDISF